MGKIFSILESLELTSKDTVKIFSESTRDVMIFYEDQL